MACVADLGASTVWPVVIGAAVGTYLLRLSFLEVLADRDIPPRVETALRFVPPAVLAALVLPKLLLVDGAVTVSPGNHRLVAGAVAGLVGYRTEDMLATVAAGMGTLWALLWLAGL